MKDVCSSVVRALRAVSGGESLAVSAAKAGSISASSATSLSNRARISGFRVDMDQRLAGAEHGLVGGGNPVEARADGDDQVGLVDGLKLVLEAVDLQDVPHSNRDYWASRRGGDRRSSPAGPRRRRNRSSASAAFWFEIISPATTSGAFAASIMATALSTNAASGACGAAGRSVGGMAAAVSIDETSRGICTTTGPGPAVGRQAHRLRGHAGNVVGILRREDRLGDRSRKTRAGRSPETTRGPSTWR